MSQCQKSDSNSFKEFDSLRDMKVAILGLAYRGGVKLHFRSIPSSGIYKRSWRLSSYPRPLFSDEEIRSLGLEPYNLGDSCGLAIVQADHQLILRSLQKIYLMPS